MLCNKLLVTIIDFWFHRGHEHQPPGWHSTLRGLAVNIACCTRSHANGLHATNLWFAEMHNANILPCGDWAGHTVFKRDGSVSTTPWVITSIITLRDQPQIKRHRSEMGLLLRRCHQNLHFSTFKVPYCSAYKSSSWVEQMYKRWIISAKKELGQIKSRERLGLNVCRNVSM